MKKRHRPASRVDREKELERMSPEQRLELFLAIDEIRHYLASAPGSTAVITAPKLYYAARMRGVNLPVKAFVTAMSWLDRHQGVPPNAGTDV